MFNITPPNSSPVKLHRKRGRDDDVVYKIKRWQNQKIHTEVHQKTVQLLFEAQRKAYQTLETEPSLEQEQEQEIKEETYAYQKPYWPVINKSKE